MSGGPITGEWLGLNSQELDSYRYFAGVMVGGVPLLLAMVGGYAPFWRRGTATVRTRAMPGAWILWTVGAAVVLALATAAAFMFHLRSTQDASLLNEEFWGGFRDGLAILGFLFGGLVIIVLVAVRKIVMAVRGVKPYAPYEQMSTGQLVKLSKQESRALRARLEAGVPDGAAREQAVECLTAAEALHEHARESMRRSAREYEQSSYFVAMVLCRVGRTALDTGHPMERKAPFCWHNPLHGQATGTAVLGIHDQEPEPRALCGGCLEALHSDPEPVERVVRIPHPYVAASKPYFEVCAFYFDGNRGLDRILQQANGVTRPLPGRR